MKIEQLKKVLPQAWSPRIDISLEGIFNRDDPSVGQCAVTALVVQDYFGGEILNTIVTGSDFPGISSSHYFNVIDGETIDLTRSQFKKGTHFSEALPKNEGLSSTREYMLSFPSTVERYEALKLRVNELLKDSPVYD